MIKNLSIGLISNQSHCLLLWDTKLVLLNMHSKCKQFLFTNHLNRGRKRRISLGKRAIISWLNLWVWFVYVPSCCFVMCLWKQQWVHVHDYKLILASSSGYSFCVCTSGFPCVFLYHQLKGIRLSNWCWCSRIWEFFWNHLDISSSNFLRKVD